MENKVANRNKNPVAKNNNLSVNKDNNFSVEDKLNSYHKHKSYLIVILVITSGLSLVFLSGSFGHSFLISTVNTIGTALIISSIVMVGFRVMTSLLEERFIDILNLKSSKLTPEQEDEDSEIFGEYFLEISELNKKMEKEQKEIDQIKSETYQIAIETQEILSNLRIKAGMI